MKKNYEGAESGERKKNKKVIFSSKKEFVRGHSFMTSTKKDQISGRPSTPLFTNIQFWSKHTPLLDIPNWHSIPPG